MTIQGGTFDRMRVTPMHDSIPQYLATGGESYIINNYKNEMFVTKNGLSVTVDTGAAIVWGRMVYVTEPETLTIPANALGYICIVIDLTKQNTSTGTPGQDDYSPVNNQVTIQYVEESAFTWQNLWNDGKLFMFPIRKVKSTTSAVTLGNAYTGYFPLKLTAGWRPRDGNASNTPRILAQGNGLYEMLGYVEATKEIAADVSSTLFNFGDQPTMGLIQSWKPGLMSRQYVQKASGSLYGCTFDITNNRFSVDWRLATNTGSAAITKISPGLYIPLGGIYWFRGGNNGPVHQDGFNEWEE